MMMKHFVLLLTLALVIGGCRNQSQDSEKVAAETTVVNQESDAEVVKQRVQEIYSEVFKEYNLEDSLRNLDQLEGLGAYARSGEFCRNYCSQEWNGLVSQIAEIDSMYHDGELGFWEADYWIMGQDWHQLSISDVEVLSVTPSQAAVNLNLHNLDNVKPVVLLLVKENDTWKIDDFKDVNNDLDWKRSMQEYVEAETAKTKK